MPPLRKTEALMPLQELDLQIHRLKVQRAEKPRLLASSEEKLARAKHNVDAIHGEIRDLKLEGAKRELSVKECDERVNKIQTQAMTAKKNDEYQAYQKEISGVKAEKARVEDGLLDIYMQVEEKVKLEKVRQEEVGVADKEFAAAKKVSDAEVAEFNRGVEAKLSQRAALAGAVEKEVLRVYERVLRAKDDGVALAPAEKYEVIEDEGKVIDWRCGGCAATLNLQDVNLIMMGRDVNFCRGCSRLLYIKPA